MMKSLVSDNYNPRAREAEEGRKIANSRPA
jgi:hypothetical protein